MTKLSDTQLVILGAAAQRADLSVLPLPDSLKLKGGALTKVMDALRNRGMIRVIESRRRARAGGHHQRGHGRPRSRVGRRRAHRRPGGRHSPDAGRQRRPGGRGPGSDHRGRRRGHAGEEQARQTQGQGEGRQGRAGRQRARGGDRPTPTGKPTPRAGTKQALMIDMLKRPEGATVEQIAAATGWQHHTIRGAISGALKKKLGLTVEATRTREVGPNKTGAKGSSTVYRIVS